MCCYKQPACSSMLILLTLLLSYGVGTTRCSMVSENSTDMLSLLEFKQAITHDPTGALNSWTSSTPFCRWGGVTCSSTHPGRVIRLDLADRRLTGSIASSLGNLTFLKLLNLSTNSFSGELPHLNRLHKLQFLIVANNSLGGVIPDTLTNCSNLREIHLANNHLSGEIPLEINLLSNLRSLKLSINNLTGTITPTLGNMSRLQVLSLSDNQLTGGIPEELGQLSTLSTLALSGNRLSGGIPDALLNLSSLQSLGLDSNMLDKELPSNIGNAFSQIILITLGANMFGGPIPASLGNASNLNVLDLSINKLTGQIPSSFGKLSQLQWLNLENNSLEADDSQSWEFVDALGNCSLLQTLSVSHNQMHGAIPNSVGKLSGIQQLLMTDNYLSGIVPMSIGNLTSLTTLALDQNSLSGTVDGWVGNLTELQGLSLQKNKFFGAIPSSIGNLTQLLSLSLADNEFNGSIPSNLGNLTKLSEFDLSYNDLHGPIPAGIFSSVVMTKFVLSYNKLEGPIPLEVTNLQQLTILDLSSNSLDGEIPSGLGKCVELEIVRMDRNLFTGNIPMSLGDLSTLSVLDLSHNNLSGSIPEAISRLQLLNCLNLSYNHLEGPIPRNGVFANTTAKSLSNNWGLCGGSSDLHMPPCSSVSEGSKMQYYLVRILIPVFGFLSLILLIYLIVLEKNRPIAYSSLSPFGKQFPKVSYKDLAEATQNFSESNLVGRGSYGSVYRGKLSPSKLEVAVKVLHLEMRGAERSFISECEALRGIQHRNLLPIITTCSTVDNEGNAFKALIYEFMPNGNLDTWLHPNGDGKSATQLHLNKRINIAANIADVLSYLHHDTGRPIIHCDLKPSNILLDDDMNAHLGDFGISSFYRNSAPTSLRDSISSIGLKGTIGYIAPEYAGGGHPSTCGDAYSFGIVLLEMLTGKRPTDPMFADGLNIVNFVEGNCKGQMLLAIDAALQEECYALSQVNMENENVVFRCLTSLLEVALSCARQLPNERISMREAAIRISAIKSIHIGGQEALKQAKNGHNNSSLQQLDIK